MSSKRGSLPNVTVIEITGLDENGEALARPVTWRDRTPPPDIVVQESAEPGRAPGIGDRALARMTRIDRATYRAHIIRLLPKTTSDVLGVYERTEAGPRLKPVKRGERYDYMVREDRALKPEPGAIYRAEVLPESRRRLGLKQVRLLERIGSSLEPGAFSMLAIHELGIPTDFSDATQAAASASGPAPLADREDLRAVALVTIDGADARDFDDAVYAVRDDAPDNPGGWRLLVAIADVSWYVRPDSPLDRDALERGNSVYFPDRVVPMLPEALSNGWCSLVPGEDRPCLAVWIHIDAEGEIRQHRFLRGMMRSHARLTYAQAQAAADRETPLDRPIQAAVEALYGAHGALLQAREKRGSLELELPERQIFLDAEGKVEAIRPRDRLGSHRLIEDLMITANVAAATALEALKQPCMYRVHEPPDPVKLEALRSVLDSMEIKGLKLTRGQGVRPGDLNRLLSKAKDHPGRAFLHESILRSQAQAVYAPRNLGHFGLGLHRYAHFTSPIRRYADLLVHRALVGGLGLGDGALPKGAAADFAEIGQDISATERRASAAERQVVDRYMAAFLAGREGALFAGRIAGCTRAGLFVELHETGAQGLMPMSALVGDRYQLDPSGHALVGRRWGGVYRLGDAIEVRLVECRPLAGGLLFAPADGGVETESPGQGDGPGPQGTKSRRSGGKTPGGARKGARSGRGRAAKKSRGGR